MRPASPQKALVGVGSLGAVWQLGKGTGRSRATQVSPGVRGRAPPGWVPPPPPPPCPPRAGWGISDLHPGSPWGSKASLQQGGGRQMGVIGSPGSSGHRSPRPGVGHCAQGRGVACPATPIGLQRAPCTRLGSPRGGSAGQHLLAGLLTQPIPLTGGPTVLEGSPGLPRGLGLGQLGQGHVQGTSPR